MTDTERLDWLEQQIVEVRKPRRYGSQAMFFATPDLEGDPSDLRDQIDAVMPKTRSSAPHVQANVTLVPHGYQIDIFLSGKKAGSVCRDFGGNWPISRMQAAVAATLIHAMQSAEKTAILVKQARKKK